MKPQKIKLDKEKTKLILDWNSENQSEISLKYLREECPCANCKGETILLKTIRPPRIQYSNAKMFEVKNLEPVGSYGLKITWQDGHDTGIYSWDYLKTLSEDEASGERHDYDPLI